MIHLIIIWGLIILFIVQPGVAHYGAEEGAKLFTTALLPYLLPYIILTQWLLKTSTASHSASWRRYFKAYVLGAFGGFPVGAVTISEMKKRKELTGKESEQLLAACHAPGPMFIIGFVGTELFGDIRMGWSLLIAIHLANIAFFLLTLFLRKSKQEISKLDADAQSSSRNSPLLDAIKESSNVIILVATTVIFFSALGTVLANLISETFAFDTGITQTALLAIFEMTAGVQSALVHFEDFSFFPILVAAIISLNGISIHMQVAVIAKAAGLSIRLYILARLWNIMLVPILFYFLI